MKKTFVTILMAILLVAAVSLAESTLLDAALALLPEEAQLVRQEKDDGLYEYKFRSGKADYEVVMNHDGAPLMLQTAYSGVKNAENAVLDASAAASAALALFGEEAAVDYSLLEKDGKRYVWKVFVLHGQDVTEMEVNAESGAVKETERYYGSAAALLPSAAAEKIRQEKGDVTIQELDLELDDGRLICSGAALVDGKKYEYEISITDGIILEWERD